LIITAFCIGAVLICYFWIDRPVAFFVYRHRINTIEVPFYAFVQTKDGDLELW
jgi:hypothetical protein